MDNQHTMDERAISETAETMADVLLDAVGELNLNDPTEYLLWAEIFSRLIGGVCAKLGIDPALHMVSNCVEAAHSVLLGMENLQSGGKH